MTSSLWTGDWRLETDSPSSSDRDIDVKSSALREAEGVKCPYDKYKEIKCIFTTYRYTPAL